MVSDACATACATPSKAPTPATAPPLQICSSNVAAQNLMADNASVIPSTEFLRTNEQIQKQVDARFAELHTSLKFR